MIKEINLLLDKLKDNLCAAKERMKKVADKGKREVEYEVGDYVFLKIQSYCFRSIVCCPNKKLWPHFYGSYEILERVGMVVYRLKLPLTAKIHPYFHVSQLKNRIDPNVSSQPLSDFLNEENELVVQPEEVLDYGYSPQGELELLNKWQQLW